MEVEALVEVIFGIHTHTRGSDCVHSCGNLICLRVLGPRKASIDARPPFWEAGSGHETREVLGMDCARGAV